MNNLALLDPRDLEMMVTEFKAAYLRRSPHEGDVIMIMILDENNLLTAKFRPVLDAVYMTTVSCVTTRTPWDPYLPPHFVCCNYQIRIIHESLFRILIIRDSQG